jgi:hypothetical protein
MVHENGSLVSDGLIGSSSTPDGTSLSSTRPATPSRAPTTVHEYQTMNLECAFRGSGSVAAVGEGAILRSTIGEPNLLQGVRTVLDPFKKVPAL